MRQKLDYSYCQAAPVLEWMSRKWALVTLMRMQEACAKEDDRGIRFGDLFRTIPQISEKMLASTLDYLVAEALVRRVSHGGMPPCVAYTLTPIALDFLREISYVVEWGQLHYDEIIAGRARQAFSAKQSPNP